MAPAVANFTTFMEFLRRTAYASYFFSANRRVRGYLSHLDGPETEEVRDILPLVLHHVCSQEVDFI